MQELIKDKSILDLIEKLKLQTDFDKAEITDYWDALLCSIGIKKGNRLVYIDALEFSEGKIDGYYYELELLTDEIDVYDVIQKGNATEHGLITIIKSFLEI
jgi:hypothetical protein